MCGSKPTDALRTLPERAFRLRARLIAVGLCAVCFAGLIGRLFWLQLCTGGWYTQRALGQQLRDTVVPADRGKIYSADGALLAANSSCWTLRASPREMPEEKLALAAKGLAEILELDEAKLLEKFNDRRSNDCLLRYRVERETADAVLLSVPCGLMGSFLFAWLFGLENNIYMQTGLIMIIGLLAKTAILLTEYAGKRRSEGMTLSQAAYSAAKVRLRPILMTVLSMVFGLIPLMMAHGVGANGSRSLATGVIGGMIVGTLALLFLVPSLFITFQYIQEQVKRK